MRRREAVFPADARDDDAVPLGGGAVGGAVDDELGEFVARRDARDAGGDSVSLGVGEEGIGERVGSIANASLPKWASCSRCSSRSSKSIPRSLKSRSNP